MPIYQYTARDQNGKTLTGSQEADTEATAIRILQGQGLLVTKVEDAGAAKKRELVAGAVKKRHRRVKADDLLFFIQQMATMLDSGIPLVRAIDIIGDQSQSETLRLTLESVKQDIKVGSTLKDAMARNPKVFPSLWASLIEAGEVSGQLPLVLTQLAQGQEMMMNLPKKVISALVYPSVVICVAIGTITVFLLFLIPIFAKLYADFGAKLPGLTQAVVDLSALVRRYFLLFLAVIGVTTYLTRTYIATPGGRRSFDGFILRIPVFGEFIRDSILARIAINLSTLMRSGVNLLKSLEITSRASGNLLFESAMNTAVLEIRQGKSLSAALGSSALFSPVMVHMISTGEESGKLADMLGHVARYYESRVDVFISRLGVLIEPAILVFVGGVVGVLVVAMFLPIFSLSQAIK